MKKLFFSTILISIISCASNPDTIDAAYVSPLKYAAYDCDQIGAELGYVGQRTNTLYSNLRDKRSKDNWQMGVGLILFWPTLFALEGGDGADAAEYAQLKGEFEALRQNSVEKRCALALQSPDEILEEARATDAAVEEMQAEGSDIDTPLSDRLREIDDLKTQGLITEEEYQQLRQQALGI
ncbi:SHOCT domain-containing protein [Gammaproteobacteria bacterium]|jgi:hypothetical protein|nr:SHOCT domain-containing protein [Gammaproteobacteria bacterium]